VNRDVAVSSRNELEAIILTESVSLWRKPAREKIHPCVAQPAQWAVSEGRTGTGGESRRAKTPLRPLRMACSGGPEITSIVDQVALTKYASPRLISEETSHG
jgi:hypothetical protein